MHLNKMCSYYCLLIQAVFLWVFNVYSINIMISKLKQGNPISIASLFILLYNCVLHEQPGSTEHLLLPVSVRGIL